MKLVKKLIILSFIMLFSSLECIHADTHPDQDRTTIPLQFESIFPDSSYKRVHNLCIDMWQDLRNTKEQEINSHELVTVNETIIDDLMLLSHRVSDMLDDPHCCSADDLEYIMEILQIMHREYVHLLDNTFKSDQSVCISVLFDHITKTLGRPLDGYDWQRYRRKRLN